MLHCLHCVLWLEFSVWGLSHKLFVALEPENNNFTPISPQNVPLFSHTVMQLNINFVIHRIAKSYK